MGQNLRPGFAQQLETSTLVGFRELPRSCDQRSSIVPADGQPAPGGRTGRPPRAGGAWGGRGKRAGRQALAMLSASAKQIGMRQGASVRVKQSKSQQIVANAMIVRPSRGVPRIER